MDSILQGTAASLRVTFTVDGVATDPTGNAVTVTITNSAGTAVVTAGAATRIAAGIYGYTLTATETADLDILTAAWTGTLSGVAQTLRTQAEIVGGYYFTTAEFKAAYPTDTDVQALTAAQIAKGRRTAEDIIERECHVAFVPRAKKLTLSGQRTTRLDLAIYALRSVRSVSIDGEAQDVSDYRVGNGGVYRATTWPRNVSNVAITVTHGYDAPPEHLKDAAMTLTYHHVIKSPITDRATSAPAGDAGGVITLLTPTVGAAITGIPDVDAAIIANRLPDPRSVSSVPLVDAANTYPDPWEDFAIG